MLVDIFDIYARKGWESFATIIFYTDRTRRAFADDKHENVNKTTSWQWLQRLSSSLALWTRSEMCSQYTCIPMRHALRKPTMAANGYFQSDCRLLCIICIICVLYASPDAVTQLFLWPWQPKLKRNATRMHPSFLHARKRSSVRPRAAESQCVYVRVGAETNQKERAHYGCVCVQRHLPYKQVRNRWGRLRHKVSLTGLARTQGRVPLILSGHTRRIRWGKDHPSALPTGTEPVKRKQQTDRQVQHANRDKPRRLPHTLLSVRVNLCVCVRERTDTACATRHSGGCVHRRLGLTSTDRYMTVYFCAVYIRMNTHHVHVSGKTYPQLWMWEGSGVCV